MLLWLRNQDCQGQHTKFFYFTLPLFFFFWLSVIRELNIASLSESHTETIGLALFLTTTATCLCVYACVFHLSFQGRRENLPDLAKYRPKAVRSKISPKRGRSKRTGRGVCQQVVPGCMWHKVMLRTQKKQCKYNQPCTLAGT